MITKSCLLISLLTTLPGCLTSEVLRDVEWEQKTWREIACANRSVRHGQDAGIVTIHGNDFHDYRFAGCLRGKGKTRTLRLLVPVAPTNGASAVMTETSEPATDDKGIALTLSSVSYQSAGTWKGYLARTGRRATGVSALAVYVPDTGDGTLFFDENESGEEPRVGQMAIRIDLRCVERSAAKGAASSLMLPVAVAGDAFTWIFAGTGGCRPPTSMKSLKAR